MGRKEPSTEPSRSGRVSVHPATSPSIVHLLRSPMPRNIFGKGREEGAKQTSRITLWSEQLAVACESSWVCFLFRTTLFRNIDLHVACSEQLAHARPQDGGDLPLHANFSRRASRAVAEIPVPGKNTPLS